MSRFYDNELVIGIVAAVGTETTQVVTLLQEAVSYTHLTLPTIYSV